MLIKVNLPNNTYHYTWEMGEIRIEGRPYDTSGKLKKNCDGSTAN
jgi:hypothetical protein